MITAFFSIILLANFNVTVNVPSDCNLTINVISVKQGVWEWVGDGWMFRNLELPKATIEPHYIPNPLPAEKDFSEYAEKLHWFFSNWCKGATFNDYAKITAGIDCDWVYESDQWWYRPNTVIPPISVELDIDPNMFKITEDANK